MSGSVDMPAWGVFCVRWCNLTWGLPGERSYMLTATVADALATKDRVDSLSALLSRHQVSHTDCRRAQWL